MTRKYTLVTFEAWHMEALAETDSVDGFNAVVVGEALAARLEQTDSYTLFLEDGTCLACGGFIPEWEGRWTGWMFITVRTSKHMIELTRVVQRMIEPIKGRIEITVRKDFEAGHRWAKILGFEVENPPGILKQYGPEGEDHISYVRMN